jgi:hypothetical protein
VALPAGNGTVNVIRREGNDWAKTSDVVPAPMIAAARRQAVTWKRIFIIDDS